MENSFKHATVLLRETIDGVWPDSALFQRWATDNPKGEGMALSPQPLVFVDCTLGGGGHVQYFLERLIAWQAQGEILPRIHILGIDRDEEAIRAAHARLSTYTQKINGENPENPNRNQVQFEAVRENFSQLNEILTTRGFNTIHGLWADFGVSSPQLDEGVRGFSFAKSGPLDMRMDTSQSLTAEKLLLESDERELARIFFEYGEEPRSRQLARSICKDRSSGSLPSSDSIEFAEYVRQVLGYRQSRHHPATRVFQALRIAVNRELDAIVELLETVPRVLEAGGRTGFISFHSLEDRLVKRRFRAWEKGGTADEDRGNVLPWHAAMAADTTVSWGKELPRGGIVPSEEEVQSNFRARSARLRIFEFDQRVSQLHRSKLLDQSKQKRRN